MRRMVRKLNSARLGAMALLLVTPLANAQAPATPAAPAAQGTPGAGGPGGGGGMRRMGAAAYDYADNEGFTQMFDGKTMTGWDGDTRFFSVKDGALYMNPTCEKPSGTVYAIWTGGEATDFILKYELKGTTGINSGVQFRSYRTEDQNVGVRYPARPARVAPPAGARPAGAPGAGGAAGAPGGGAPGGGAGGGFAGRPPACANPGTRPTDAEEAKWNMNGPQADFDGNNNFSGMFYEQGGRGIIATPGHVILSEAGKPVKDLGVLADKATLDSWFKKGEYNQFVVIAKGNSVSIIMNGHLITQFIDTDPTYYRAGGKIGLEVENTGEIWGRNFFLKKL